MMRARFYFLIVAASSLGVSFAQNSVYEPDPKWQAPAEATTKLNPLADRPNVAAGGQKLYRRHCAECHGDTGQGLKKAADFHLPVVQQQTDGSLFWKITNGNPDRGMPSFSRLPELQRWQIVLYLRQLHPEGKGNH
jgi:mono/diheme cytochrome c family protein